METIPPDDVTPRAPLRVPLDSPNLTYFTSLCEALAHWLEVSRLREGEKPRKSRRYAILNATKFLCFFKEQHGRDGRWANVPRYQKNSTGPSGTWTNISPR